jgi:DNA-binding NarL/FixJ family response regulator
MLQSSQQYEVLGEAADGMEAIQRAKDLQPDLILLDIGLPKLNGMAAAQEIRQVAPLAKLLFVTMESSREVIKQAFRVGAHGYLHKMRFQLDLMSAIEGVLAGSRFLNGDLAIGNAIAHRKHEVHFYSDENLILQRAARLIGASLKMDGVAVALTTPAHREDLAERLAAQSVDVSSAMRKGTYVCVDAMEAISTITSNGVPDSAEFFALLNEALQPAAKATGQDTPHVVVFGECCGLLHAAGHHDVCVDIEKAGNDMTRGPRTHVMCAYPVRPETAPTPDRLEPIALLHASIFSHQQPPIPTAV